MKKAILLLLCVSMMLCGCASGSSFTKNSIESMTDTTWTMSYEQFDGMRTMKVPLEESAAAQFTIAIETKSGALGLYITGADGTEYYKGSDLPTSEFTVMADKGGSFEIRIEADRHCGSFAVSWSSQQ